MKRPATIRRKYSTGQRGFALLTVVFLAALVLIAAAAASLSVVTDGKREKEKEMIWRGNQYVRAVKLFYRKNGRFPAEIDDLAKAKTGSIRFLRQAYKDPMNKVDGTWRFIYVGPAGQLIGSLKPHPLFKLPTPASPGGAAGTPAGTAVPAAGSSGAAGSAAGTGQAGASGTAAGASGSTPGAAGGTSSGDSSSSGSGTGQPEAPDLPPGNVDSPTVFGGKIIGVGSKIDGRSVVVYDKAKNYRLFEFIWDPSKDTGGSSQPLQTIPGGSQPGQPGQSGFGQPTTPPTGAPPPNPTPPPQN